MPNQETQKANNKELIGQYADFLREEERSEATIKKYVRDLLAFFSYQSNPSKQTLNKDKVLAWKEYLVQTYAPASVNSMLAALNSFLDWCGVPQYKAKPLKIQREIFVRPEKELSQTEYRRLVEAAEREGNRRLSLLLQTICSTGIRVSELRYITVAALQTGRAIVECKGKTRTVFLPKYLCQVLRRYCRDKKIDSGILFCTKGGKAIDRSNIWRMMKNLCKNAGVESEKVFPHNLRHLFARTYYSLEKDLSRLADLLGHSSVNTTKIYTMESGRKHAKQLDRMGLIFSKM